MRRRTVLAAAAAAPWARVGQAQDSANDARPVIAWPDIRLLDGGTFSPGSWQGQPAVVVFWATDCPYCRRHNAHVDKLHRAVRGQPLRVLGVALDSDAGSVRAYMSTHHYEFPVALDGGDLRRRLTLRRVIPMTCVIDRQGRLLQAIPGEMFEDDVLGLARLLQRQPA